MKKILLSDSWRLTCMEPQEGLVEEIELPRSENGEWMDVAVPGDVNGTLLKYGKIPDPHFDTQARACYWVTSKEWWYSLEFQAPKTENGCVDLCMTNVDGNTDIWLNEQYIGKTENAFRLFRFPIKNIHEGLNTIMIRFKSIDSLLGGPRTHELAGWKGRRAFLRKPQFSFGWDWALPLPSIGLAGEVWLETDNACRFIDMSVQPFISGRVDFSFEISEEAKRKGYGIAVRLYGHGNDLQRTVNRNAYRSYTSFTLENPQLWYPNGYGEQPLYYYRAELIIDGYIADFREGQIGLRESRIIEKPFTEDAGHGFSFWLEINSIPVFSKGGNWIPMEIWPGMIKPEDYEFYLRRAKEANFNMLRVWGGGIYESELFYRLCDELGIMVWQDFMFASTGYPVDLLRDEIIAEADYQIRRLRNHCCIVLWCGCNEDVHSWGYRQDSPAVSKQQDTGVYSEIDQEWSVDRAKDDPQIYIMILRGMTGRYGLGVPYVESSPQSKEDAGNMPNSGNSHISCWKYSLLESGGKYENFRKHFEKICSFNSEFCIQGPSSVKMIKSFLKEENHWPPNDAWVYHIQKGHANLPHHEQTLRIAGAILGEIDSLQKYVKYGQTVHVEMMRAEFESARRDYPNNGGTMMWMYNDCWPTANWSIIDYHKNPKPSYYAAKRACAPYLPIIFERQGNVEFLFSNQTKENTRIEVVYGQRTLAGKNVFNRTSKLEVKANESFVFDSMKRTDLTISKGDYLFIEGTVNNKKFQEVIYFTDGWKDISWPTPEVKFEFVEQKFNNNCWHTSVKILTDAFTRMCHLLYKGSDKSVFLSDNYFDVTSGSTHEITIYSNEKVKAEEISAGHWWTDWD